MTKHTPGPWIIEDGVIRCPDGWPPILDLRNADELQANACLIAAAPNLLEACITAMAAIYSIQDDYSYIRMDGIRALEEGIAKVEAES